MGTALKREEEGVMQRTRQGKWEVPCSVRSHVPAYGSGLGASDPDSRAVVEEVFGAAPGEGFIGRLLTKSVEKVDCLTVAPRQG